MKLKFKLVEPNSYANKFDEDHCDKTVKVVKKHLPSEVAFNIWVMHYPYEGFKRTNGEISANQKN